MNSIQENLKDTCSGCGLCESICPQNAISINEEAGFLRPKVNDECVECGRCVSVCPGRIDSEHISYKMFQYIQYGHTNNGELRKEAASGAITSELIKFMLDSDIVDYVITSDVYKYDRELGFVVIDKNHSKKLEWYSGSNYCPVNIGRAVRQIKEVSGRYAIVCLPCLARGLDRARKMDKQLASRIKFVISLLCNHVPSYEATDYLIKKYKIKMPKLLKYRGDGWFGSFRTFDSSEKGKKTYSVPFSEYYATKYSEYFWQKACIDCKDHFGFFADASMGDADFVKYRTMEPNDGETIVFSNNPDLVGIIKLMVEKGLICCYSDISQDELMQIYGPLGVSNRADNQNLRSGVDSILWEEKKNKIFGAVLKKLFFIKNGIDLIKERMT